MIDDRTLYERAIAARLEALIARAGTTVRAVSLQLGRPAHELHRRLKRPTADPRPLRWQDVAEVLDALGLDPLAIDGPVLLTVDERVLAWIAARSSCTAADVLELFSDGAESLDRLRAQALVREDEEARTLTLTPTGRKTAATLET